jgi:hypothetical protein
MEERGVGLDVDISTFRIDIILPESGLVLVLVLTSTCQHNHGQSASICVSSLTHSFTHSLTHSLTLPSASSTHIKSSSDAVAVFFKMDSAWRCPQHRLV